VIISESARPRQSSILHEVANGGTNWKNSRIWGHTRDVVFLSSFLILTAVPLFILKGLKHFFDEPDLWDVLSEIDKIGTVVIFTMFWIAIIVRLWAEIVIKLKRGEVAPNG
jgi:hypothetical protein